MMLPDHDLHIHADFAGAPENFEHASGRRQPAFGITRDFNIHDGAVELRQAHAAARRRAPRPSRASFWRKSRRQFFARRNQHFVQNARVVWQHVISVRAVAEKSRRSSDAARSTTSHDAAFGATVRAAPLDAREHVIAMHRVAQIVAADEQISFHARDRLIRHHETVTIAMRHESAGNQIRVARHVSMDIASDRWCRRLRIRSALGALLRPRSACVDRVAGAAARPTFPVSSPASRISPAVISSISPRLFELLDHARQKAPAVVLQSHAVRDLRGCFAAAIASPDARAPASGVDFAAVRSRSGCVFWRFIGIHIGPLQANGLRTRVGKIRSNIQRDRALSWRGSCDSCAIGQLLLVNQWSIRMPILPSGSRSSAGAYSPSSSRRHQSPVSRFVFMSVNQY